MKKCLLFVFLIVVLPVVNSAQSVDKLMARFYQAYEQQEYQKALVFVQDAQEKLTGVQIDYQGESLERQLEQFPELTASLYEVLVNHSIIFEKLQEYDKALSYCIFLKSRNKPERYQERAGHYYVALERWEDAVDFFQKKWDRIAKVPELWSMKYNCLYNLALSYAQLEKVGETAIVLDQIWAMEEMIEHVFSENRGITASDN